RTFVLFDLKVARVILGFEVPSPQRAPLRNDKGAASRAVGVGRDAELTHRIVVGVLQLDREGFAGPGAYAFTTGVKSLQLPVHRLTRAIDGAVRKEKHLRRFLRRRVTSVTPESRKV